MAEVHVVLWVYSDYEGTSTTLVKAFTDPTKAEALAQDINDAVASFAKVRKCLPVPAGIHKAGPKRDAILKKWQEDATSLQQENATKAIELYDILVATHGDFGANLLLPSLDGPYPVLGFLDADIEHQSAQVETVPFS